MRRAPICPTNASRLSLCQAELAQREARRVERAIAAARFPVRKDLSSFEWSCVQGVSKLRVLELAQGGYIANAEPILLVGNPGLGKTHVATGLALAACRQGLRVRFYNVAGLVNDLLVAPKELRLFPFLNQDGHVQLGGLDGLGFLPLYPPGPHSLSPVCSVP